MKLPEKMPCREQANKALELAEKLLNGSRELFREIKDVRDALAEQYSGKGGGSTFKESLTKARFTHLYEDVPGEALADVLETTDHYDRIGPITLPLEIPATGEVVNFTVFYFGFYNNQDYFLLTTNPELDFDNPLVRVSSNCNWAFDFGSKRCECNWELEHAKETMVDEKDGMIIFALDQHGKSIPGATRGHSLIYALGQAQNQDLVRSAYVDNGFDLDYREYGDVVQILKDVGVSKFRLMTNNPERLEIFDQAGFEGVEREPIEKPYDENDAEELGVKRERLGHLLELPDFKEEDVGIYGLDPDKVFKDK